jgi:IclR family transcriptional regulator, KDG regulon repressor
MPDASQTADHALIVLLELAYNGTMPAGDLARQTGLNRTVLRRLLLTLERRGFVVRSDAGYSVGPVVPRLAARVEPALRAAAARPLTAAGVRTRETVVLHTVDAEDAVVLEQRVGTLHMLRVQQDVGSRHPLVLGAGGRALLAFLSEAWQARVLRTSDDPDRLQRQIDHVRAVGYAISHEEIQPGVHGLAVPVRRADGIAVASVSVIAPVTRALPLGDHLEILLDTAAAIGLALDGADVGLPAPSAPSA